MISRPAESLRFAVTGACVLLFAARALAQVDHGDVLGLNVDFLQVTETTLSAGDPATLYGAPIEYGYPGSCRGDRADGRHRRER